MFALRLVQSIAIARAFKRLEDSPDGLAIFSAANVRNPLIFSPSDRGHPRLVVYKIIDQSFFSVTDSQFLSPREKNHLNIVFCGSGKKIKEKIANFDKF